MSALVEVPQRFDEWSFELFAQSYARAAASGASKVIVDAHALEWASPFGFVGLLAAGQALGERTGSKPMFTAPLAREVNHYMGRNGFVTQAESLFEIHGKFPRVRAQTRTSLLEITPIKGSEDVHSYVGQLQDRSSEILNAELGLPLKATMRFGMALSEACQNIVEHAGTSGWVAVQAYTWKKTLGKRVVVVATADAGVGFRHTLESTQAGRYGERWGDGAALEAALLQSVSRFRDANRGHGLENIRKFVGTWDGKMIIRSGTARIALVPEWDQDDPLTTGLAPFPGAQVQVVIPAEAQDRK